MQIEQEFGNSEEGLEPIRDHSEPGNTNPLALRLVSALFLVSGLWAAFSILFGLLHGHIRLNFNILGLWIGPGLILHNRTCRTLALCFIWIGLIMLPIFALFTFSRSSVAFRFLGIPIGHIPGPAALLCATAIFLLTLWQYRVLTRPEIGKLFRPKRWKW